MTFAERLEELLGKREETFWIFAIERELLRNADAILELVRAAEVMVGWAEGDDLEAEARMVEALAKLNGEPT